MKTPLKDITVTCSGCDEDCDAQSVNDDKMRFHLPFGSIARFPPAGLTSKQIQQIPSLELRCELCHQDR